MDTYKKSRYERIILTEHLIGLMQHAEEWDGPTGVWPCHECGETTQHDIWRWGCDLCGNIDHLPGDWDVLRRHSPKELVAQARRVYARADLCDNTNAELARRHGVSKRQASKIRKYGRDVLEYVI